MFLCSFSSTFHYCVILCVYIFVSALILYFEDGWGKGGKGGKFANGGKSPVKKPIPPLELRVEEG